LIFIWGPPQPTFEIGLAIGVEPENTYPGTNETVAQHDQDVLEAKAFTTVMSRVGLGAVGMGFVLQIIAAVPAVAIAWNLVLVRTRPRSEQTAVQQARE
jgi:hypothetical protein